MQRVALAALAWLWASGAAADFIHIANRIDTDAGAKERPDAVAAGRAGPTVASPTAIHDGGQPADERPLLEGVAEVLDADTFIVAEQRVRLIGIDAPERRQHCRRDGREWPCGQIATAAVLEHVGTDPLICEVYGADRWGRALAVCYRDGADLNAAIVRAGWALAWYPATSAVQGPIYDAAEAEARLKAAGIWQGAFIEPWRWRQ